MFTVRLLNALNNTAYWLVQIIPHDCETGLMWDMTAIETWLLLRYDYCWDMKFCDRTPIGLWYAAEK